MVRQQNNRPSQEAGADLLSFRFSQPAPSQQQHQGSNTSRNQTAQRGRRRPQDRRTPEDRSSARRKASTAMFPLHASADHAFVLTRLPPHQYSPQSQQAYSYQGSDTPVSWESVRLVRQLVSMDHLLRADAAEETCPICLEPFCCARITKCGHVFCLVCVLHHAHAAASGDGPKCPCCAIPLHVPDLRPMERVSVGLTPAAGQRLRLVKLQAFKTAGAPSLPQPDAPHRAAPHAAPTQGDVDATYSRFNYMDPDRYQAHLLRNLQELQIQQPPTLYHSLALQQVQTHYQEALEHAAAETTCQERFGQPGAGVARPHPIHLVAQAVGGEDTETISLERAASVDSEDASHASRQRRRGDSMASQDSGASSRALTGSMYLEEGETTFYQSEDGRLCFLCSFDMSCLRADFAERVPSPQALQEATTAAQRRKLAPLPDFVEGKILEVERVHLTPEKRQRYRFLSHLPLYTDVCLVELSLGHLLSKATKKAFSKDFHRRQQSRLKKTRTEQRQDARVQRQEEERIQELKARFQRIDPNDEFFQPVVIESEPSFDGEDFGPSILAAGGGGNDASNSTRAPAPPSEPGRSFLQITQQGGGLTDLLPSNESAFPALGSSPPTRAAPTPKPWGAGAKATASPPGASGALGKKKKKGGQNIVLFSTGGQRSGAL